jgi:phage/plasmid-associated DNA primase
LEWQQEGLNPPPVVIAAMEEYLSAEDLVGQWIDECCVTGPDKTATVAALFDNFRHFCSRNEEPPGTQKRFSQMLQARGFVPTRSSKARSLLGME